jgi:hypothetical protein
MFIFAREAPAQRSIRCASGHAFQYATRRSVVQTAIVTKDYAYKFDRPATPLVVDWISSGVGDERGAEGDEPPVARSFARVRATPHRRRCARGEAQLLVDAELYPGPSDAAAAATAAEAPAAATGGAVDRRISSAAAKR